MEYKNLFLLFPVIPVFFIFIHFVFDLFLKKDISYTLVVFNAVLQMFTGAAIIIEHFDFVGIYVFNISRFPLSIVFSVDRYKVYFLVCYLIVLIFTSFSRRFLENFSTKTSRTLFLFFLTGCSGVIFSGDLFNFFVFFEIIILTSYILIADSGKYYPALKYMIFNTISSHFFLAGIGVYYYSTGKFSYSIPTHNISLLFVLFSTSFFIKSGFFPALSWVPTCHSGAKNLFSGFLSSFTISTGIIELFYYVIRPAYLNDLTNVLVYIKAVSVLTMIISCIYLFFENNLKKCVTYSTVFSMGMTGLVMASGHFEIGMIYLIIHAIYKMSFFLFLYDVEYDDETLEISGSLRSLLLYVVIVFFAVGYFPAFTYFVKKSLPDLVVNSKWLWYFTMFFMFSGFFKFTLKRKKIVSDKSTKKFFLFSTFFSLPFIGIVLKKIGILLILLKKISILPAIFIKIPVIGIVLKKIVMAFIVLWQIPVLNLHSYFYIDIIILVFTFYFAKRIYLMTFKYFTKIKEFFNNNLNYELFAILVLFMCGIVFI